MAKMKPDKQERRQEGRRHRQLARQELALGGDAEEHAHRQHADQEDRGHAEQQGHVAAERNLEHELPEDDRQHHVQQADGEIGNQLAEDQFGALHRRGNELLHGAPLPLAGEAVSEVSMAAMTIMITAISPGTM